MLVDVRGTIERESDGLIPGSVHAPRGLLDFRADPDDPDYKAAVNSEFRPIHKCGTGGRSALGAKDLIEMGFSNVASFAGGYAAWKAARE